ncbi:MAG: substrate-binding domain-containing protein [Tepidisphaeraceae bacterium]
MTSRLIDDKDNPALLASKPPEREISETMAHTGVATGGGRNYGNLLAGGKMSKSILNFVAALTAAGSLFLSGCGDKSSSPTTQSADAGAKPQIAVIAKSTVNAYWKAVEAGANQAAAESNVDILWTGPDAETNHTQQANMVDNMVTRGVNGIVLAPTNVDALVRPVESAVARHVPVILIDSTVKSDKPISVIATDNYAAGQQAADALIKAMGANHKFGGKVIMLRFLEGSGSTEAREKGFADRIAQEKGLTLVDQMYTRGGGSTTDAADTADALLRRFINNNELQVDGIFASNQPTAIGMLRKLDQFRAQGVNISCPYVGFDAHEVLLKGIRDGKIAAIVTQDPKKMGYLGVKSMAAYLKGEKIEPKIATATLTVTKENIDDPATKAVTLEN